MVTRIPCETLIAPDGIYQRQAVQAAGYRPTPSSRFAVVRRDAKTPWRLTHVRSGGSLDSIFPALARGVTMTEKLAFAAACEAATHLDFSAFDALEPVTAETAAPPSWPRPPCQATLAALREIAANVTA